MSTLAETNLRRKNKFTPEFHINAKKQRAARKKINNKI